MSQVYADPSEIRRFQGALRQFNGEVEAATGRIQSQLLTLGTTWRDAEYTRFAEQLDGVIHDFKRYLQSADGYLSHLDRKAAPLEIYRGH